MRRLEIKTKNIETLIVVVFVLFVLFFLFLPASLAEARPFPTKIAAITPYSTTDLLESQPLNDGNLFILIKSEYGINSYVYTPTGALYLPLEGMEITGTPKEIEVSGCGWVTILSEESDFLQVRKFDPPYGTGCLYPLP